MEQQRSADWHVAPNPRCLPIYLAEEGITAGVDRGNCGGLAPLAAAGRRDG